MFKYLHFVALLALLTFTRAGVIAQSDLVGESILGSTDPVT